MISPDTIHPFLKTALETSNLVNIGERYEGKVRDVYTISQARQRVLVATDRQSAFDISWCTIPLKGQILNQISTWWFDQISDIMPTQMIATPDPNVAVVKDLDMLKVEVVVRAYLTGSSKTSSWMNYNAGMREYCGNTLPEGMVKNQKFDAAIITPTTKSDDDELIDPKGIVDQGLATQEQWDEISEKAFAVFARGQKLAAERGLILVDTKYEMGLDSEGNITIGDEVHTPDSSRYWVSESYEDRFARGEEPESLDKEFFRLWLREQGFEYGKTKPEITDDVRIMLASKYIDLYERMTGNTFEVPEEIDVHARIQKNLNEYVARLKA